MTKYKEIKICIFITCLIIFSYTIGEIYGFKLFKEESGNVWSANSSPNSVHHK